MPNSFDRDETVSVALLYQTSQLEGHLKDALKELGAAVVYEALTAQMDRDALEGSGAHVVIVNLDPEIESHLDEVYDLLDDARYNVVFNDAQVSSELSGWEQARWSRHLAAKIMGRPEVSDPPRPPGSQAPPSPAQKIARGIPDAPQQSPPGHTFAPDAAATAMFSNDSGLSDALDALFSQSPAPAAAAPPAAAARIAAAPAAPAAVAPPPAADFGFDFDELLGSGNAAPSPASPAAITLELPQPPSLAAAAQASTDFQFDLPAAPRVPSAKPALDFDFDLPAAATSPPPAVDGRFDLDFDLDAAPAPPAAASRQDFDLDFDLGALDLPEPSVPPPRAAGEARDMASDFGFSDGDFGADPFGETPSGTGAASVDAEPDFSFGAELDALFDTPAAPAVSTLRAELVDFDAAFSGGAAAPAADADLVASVPSARPAAPAARTVGLPADLSKWSLEPLGEEDDAAAPSPPAAAPKAEDFGVQKMSTESFLSGGNWSLEEVVESDSDDAAAKPATPPVSVEKVDAQDYLAPQGGDPSKFDFDTSLKLDLMPMEEAISPDGPRPDFVVEHRLDGSVAVKPIRRVVVLGASIGGPEAVREYLAALPARFPALFVLAQHMGAEFLELMAAQLAKATPLTVRAPGHGERISHGEVIVVPTTHRLLFDADGVVQLAHLPGASPYSPSIDLIVRDVADRFGKDATLIIFSGMAHDAVEGAKHLAAKGGQVWVQDPDTCVISSMVDGARDAGVVTYTGSPAELAKQTVAAIGKA
ncbi:chemotaxis protein CheB [Tahibacter sp.]|uniref:chemotaxis protein CheB n=1 Tax=Tahibacter sp. TaxID=2056211 RepID=UPI0028C3D4FA|nr:chemotaxis protein CheB [Tahibacter sp.]